MARELNDTIADLFRAYTTTNGTEYLYYRGEAPLLDVRRTFMEIPINKPVFEVPVLAFDAFCKSVEKGDTDAIVVVLKTLDKKPRYFTLARYMRDILRENYYYDRLVKLTTPVEGGEPLIYYATHGAVFDAQFSPIMMCSWQMSKTKRTDGSFEYKFLRPIMRIDPECYVCRGNPIERFIVNKLPLVALDTNIYEPSGNIPECINSRWELYREIKIEVDRCPFTLRHIDTPSISTTNDYLLKLVADHIDEVIQ